MVSLTEKTTIRLPAAEVWPLLSDPALVASCIPGAALAPDQGDGLWRGSIRVKFGPTVAVFRGEAALTPSIPRREPVPSRAAASTDAEHCARWRRARSRSRVATRGAPT